MPPHATLARPTIANAIANIFSDSRSHGRARLCIPISGGQTWPPSSCAHAAHLHAHIRDDKGGNLSCGAQIEGIAGELPAARPAGMRFGGGSRTLQVRVLEQVADAENQAHHVHARAEAGGIDELLLVGLEPSHPCDAILALQRRKVRWIHGALCPSPVPEGGMSALSRALGGSATPKGSGRAGGFQRRESALAGADASQGHGPSPAGAAPEHLAGREQRVGGRETPHLSGWPQLRSRKELLAGTSNARDSCCSSCVLVWGGPLHTGSRLLACSSMARGRKVQPDNAQGRSRTRVDKDSPPELEDLTEELFASLEQAFRLFDAVCERCKHQCHIHMVEASLQGAWPLSHDPACAFPVPVARRTTAGPSKTRS